MFMGYESNNTLITSDKLKGREKKVFGGGMEYFNE